MLSKHRRHLVLSLNVPTRIDTWVIFRVTALSLTETR